MTLEQRREQARANLETIRRVRVRRAQERLERVRRARERRTMRPPLAAERRLRELCWNALVQLHSQGKIPEKWLAKHPALAEDLAAVQTGERTVNE